MIPLSPELLLRAYSAGIFPMAESADDLDLFWVDPTRRGIIPLDAFHVPRRLQRVVRRDVFAVRCDTAFRQVMLACGEATDKRPNTWINDEILRVYNGLFRRRAAHSIECWLEDRLVGGLYGVSLRGAFFGESMFSFVRDASKVALVHLVARLRLGGFRLLDTQFVTAHLAQFGAEEVSRAAYKARLAAALETPARWVRDPHPGMLGREIESLASSVS